MKNKTPNWLEIARELQSLSQTGLAFSEIDYDIQRYKRMVEISAEIVEAQTRLEKESLVQNFMIQPGYATPKIDVRSAVIKDGKILLVKEIQDGKWCMPGGWVDVGDYPAEAAERETIEESGFIVKAKKVIGVFDANRVGRPLEFFHAFKIIFLCELLGGKATSSNETSDVGFFSFDDIPELSNNRTNEKHLTEVQNHLLDKERTTYFD